MIKIIYFIIFIYSSVFAADNKPLDHTYNGIGNIFYSLVHSKNKLIYSFTHHRIDNWDKRVWEQNFINLRYKLNSNWQIGLSQGHQRGDRSNQDWIKESGVWQWKDTTHRIENLTDVLVNYKNLLGNAIVEWRNIYRQNSHFETASVVSRLSFNFFNLTCGVKCNFIFSFEEHVPLSDNETSERWIYLTHLFHLNKNLLVGPRFVSMKRTWSSTDDFEDLTNAKYENSDTLNMLGIQLVNKF